MVLLSPCCCYRMNSCTLHLPQFWGRYSHDCSNSRSPKFTTNLYRGYNGGNIKALSSQNQTKKSRKRGKLQKRDMDLQQTEQIMPNENDGLNSPFSRIDAEDGNKMMLSSDNLNVDNNTSVVVSSRSASSMHCHFWLDWCSRCFNSAGSIILVSSCRFLLLKIWPDFAESSEAAYQQVLTSLEPLDYLVIAFLPGITEELLFRGALLPLFGINWTSIFAVAALFGVLHLGSGRKYSFAIWATFVGLVYGYATTLSSSIIVAMASHSLNNLAGGIMWSSKSSKQIG